MKIRIAVVDDWGDIKDLYLTLLKNNPDAFADEYNDILALRDQNWIDKISNEKEKIFLAIEGDKLVGMGEVCLENEIAVLGKLGVLPEYRGKGIAQELISKQEECAISLGASKIRLYVMGDNSKTIDLYNKRGYSQTDFLKNDIKKGDGIYVDVVVMEKFLINRDVKK